jgi:hypothetical protein
MPYIVSVEEGFALFKVQDPVRPDDRASANRELRALPGFRPGLPLLIDVTGALEVPPFADVMAIASIHGETLGGHPVAYVTRPGAQFGVARQLEVAVESAAKAPAFVFTEYDAAVGWIRQLPDVPRA